MSKQMTEKQRLARNAYMRQWARANPEKVKLNQIHYWQKKAAQMEEDAAREREQNGEETDGQGQEG